MLYCVIEVNCDMKCISIFSLITSSAALAAAGEPTLGCMHFCAGRPPPNPSANLVGRGRNLTSC